MHVCQKASKRVSKESDLFLYALSELMLFIIYFSAVTSGSKIFGSKQLASVFNWEWKRSTEIKLIITYLLF